MATATPGTRFDTAGDSFITAAGVASLDTPQLNQTKLEIRSLVSEIAGLAATDIQLAEFLDSVLPRICQAMGATSAGLWFLRSREPTEAAAIAMGEVHQFEIELAGQYRFPESLWKEPAAASNVPPDLSIEPDRDLEQSHQHSHQISHRRILQCVADEGSPILVPPSSTRVGADRPTNPLDQSLLIVPIKLFDHCEALLEVIQPHSGGPAAQRGYLRFVAQMADLVAEFLRRMRLRELTAAANYVSQLRQAVTRISSAAEVSQRYQALVDCCLNLMHVDVALLVSGDGGWLPSWATGRQRVVAISQIETFDPRSQAVLAAERWLAGLSPAQRRATELVDVSEATELLVNGSARQLAYELNCPRIMRIPLSVHLNLVMGVPLETDLPELTIRAHELSATFATLLGSQPWSIRGSSSSSAPLTSKRQRLERLIVRASSVLLVIAIALFPMTDSLSTVAVLEAIDKHFYFAPAAAEVREVLVQDQQLVRAGQPLLKLVDHQLDAKMKELAGQQESVRLQLEQDQAALQRGRLDRASEEEVVGRINQLKITRDTLAAQLSIFAQQAEQLTITAQRDAVVTSWDTHNRLQGRQVTAGQLLLSTCATQSRWQLRLSIPERQLGTVRDALASHPHGLPVQFSLSSHPTKVQLGRLTSLSEQLVKDQEGRASVMATVAIDTAQLPIRTDGAVARASIDCGTTVAGWLLVRDAWRQAISWWRML